MIVPYEKKYEEAWDDFVLNRSINGNFLQTRNFYNYHKEDKFKDASIIFFEEDKIAAVIPANEIENEEGKILLAHQGSTYGGIVIGKNYANTINYKWIFDEMLSYFEKKEYSRVELKMHNWLYSPVENKHELLDYYFQLYHFKVRGEVGFFIDLAVNAENIEEKFEKLKRRKLNKAIKQNLLFKKIEKDSEIEEFYDVLSDNMLKFDTMPVHSLDDLLEFKNVRLKNLVSFYAVYKDETMIAGSMVFNFCDYKVFHTQYLASKRECLDYCPNEFMYTKLIQSAIDEGYRYLSFGTTCLENGKIYNESLGRYKEGFNTDSYMNRTYIWEREG